jgi:hypothetical protein
LSLRSLSVLVSLSTVSELSYACFDPTLFVSESDV